MKFLMGTVLARLTRLAGIGLTAAVAVVIVGPGSPGESGGTWGIGLARAQGPMEARLVISPPDPAIGDVVTLTASVDHPAGHRIGPLEFGEKWGPFEIRAIHAPEIVANGDGSETTSITLKAQIFQLGTVTTPEVSFTVASPSGGQSAVVAAPVSVSVRSVLDGDDLRDLRPQAELARPNPGLMVGIALASLAVGALAGYAWVRHRRGRSAGGRAGEMGPPHEWAISQLERLEIGDGDGEEKLRTHYARVSEILRRYLDGEFRLATMASTTPESSRLVVSSALEWKLGRRAMAVLRAADLVKFAGHLPAAADARELAPTAAAVIGDLHRAHRDLIESRQRGGPGTAEGR